LSIQFAQLEQLNLDAAGVDVGSAEHWVCVPAGRAEVNVRSFGCFTGLTSHGSMVKKLWGDNRRNGIYRSLLDSSLSDSESTGLEVKLVNAHHLKTVPGRKSDARLSMAPVHTYGLLAGSFHRMTKSVS